MRRNRTPPVESDGVGFTHASIEFADLPSHPARAIARRHQAAVEVWLALGSCGTPRAPREMALLQGCVNLILTRGSNLYGAAAAAAAQRLSK